MNDDQPFSLPRPLPFASLLCGALLALAPVGHSQAYPASDDRVQADIDYARGLAQDWQFVDLAEQVVEELEQRGVPDALQEELGLAKCDIYAVGARYEGDPTKRNELYGKAVDAYQEYMSENPYAENIPEAERAFVDICNRWAQVMEMQLEEQAGEEADTTREQIRNVLTEALAKTGGLIDSLESIPQRNTTQNQRYWNLLISRGEMLHGLAKASDDGTYYFGEAMETLERCAIDAGEDSWFGLRAYLELAKVMSSMESPRDAADFFEFVVEKLIPSDDDVWTEMMEYMDPATLDQVFLLSSLALPGLMDSFQAIGKTEDACNAGLHFYNRYLQEGPSLNRPFGYLALLSLAGTLVDSGGTVGGSTSAGNLAWFATEEEARGAGFGAARNRRGSVDLALSLAQLVNADNRQNTLQIRAQQMISQITARPGVSVSADLLFEAAQGEYYAKNYQAAIDGFHRILAEIDRADEATRLEFGARVHYFLGKSFEKLDRDLEAAMVHREGVLTFDDPEYDSQNADGYYDRIREVRAVVGTSDEVVNALWMEAEQILVNEAQDQDPGEILVRQGDREWANGNYPAARAKYMEVADGSPIYEKAIVKAAVCLYKEADYAGCERELTRYVEEILPDPRRVPSTRKQEGFRAEARAMGIFYLGRIAYRSRDWATVVELYADYHTEFPDQTSYGPNALYSALLGQLQLANIDGATEQLNKLVDTYPESENTGAGAFQIYRVLEAQYEANPSDELLRRMASYLERSNELTPGDDFASLRKESRLWLQLQDWAKSETLLRKLMDTFGDTEEHGEDVTKFVMPDLGDVLIAQGDPQGAFGILDPLVPDPADEDADRPSKETVLAWCRSVAGWVEGEGSQITIVPGIGGAANLEKACLWRSEIMRPVSSWSAEWFDQKFELVWCYYQWGQEDSKAIDYANTHMASLYSELGQDLTGGDGIPGIDDIVEDGGRMRQRYLWLGRRLQ